MAEERFHFAYNRYSFKNKLKTEKETYLVAGAESMIALLQTIYERDDVAFLFSVSRMNAIMMFFPPSRTFLPFIAYLTNRHA
jgi:hypothetical protein